MLPYRLTEFNNRARMLIAAFLAAALHAGLMHFEFSALTVRAPRVTIPHSVSVVLRSGKKPEPPVSEVKRTKAVQPVPKKDQPAEAEAKPLKAAASNRSAVNHKRIKTAPPPVISAAPGKVRAGIAEEKRGPAAAKTASASSKQESIVVDTPAAEGAAPKIPEPGARTEAHTSPDAAGAAAPGALRLAYPRYQVNVPPRYPGPARKRGQEGTVNLRVLVNRQGRVADLEVESSSGFSLLDRAAAAAVRKWFFEPGRRGDEKVQMWVRVPVTFKLRQ